MISENSYKPLKIIAIVQARMNSQRLPGKVLSEVAGKPLLQYLVDGVKQCRSVDQIVVATSKEKSDDPIEDFCKSCNLKYYRGQLNNVASRYKDIIDIYKSAAFIRLCGDSPLLDHRLIDFAIDRYRNGQWDIVTNILQRSFPKGQSVEVVNSKTFLNNYVYFDSSEDFEHVTRFFYRNSEQFKINNISLDEDSSGINFSVDTLEDFDLIKRIISNMDRCHWKYKLEEIIDVYNQVTAENTN